MKDPFNVYDASAAAADYLCAAGRDLTTSSGQVRAILSYNYSYDYVSMVMGLEQLYARQTGLTVPVLPTSPGAAPRHGRPRHHPPLPPVDPGPPGGPTQPGPPPLPGKATPRTRSSPPSTTPPTSAS